MCSHSFTSQLQPYLHKELQVAACALQSPVSCSSLPHFHRSWVMHRATGNHDLHRQQCSRCHRKRPLGSITPAFIADIPIIKHFR